MSAGARRAALLLAAGMAAGCGEPAPPALQGYVEGEYVRVAAPFAGTLVRLDVARGQDVAQGAALYALEAESEDVARREAQEHARRAQAQVDDLRKGRRPTEIAAARAQLAQAEALAGLSGKEFARQQDLVARGFVSQQLADEARAARDRDRSRVQELQNALATQAAGARPDELRAAEAQAAAARQALAQAEWRLRQKSVASPVAGTVTDIPFMPGEWIPAGAPVATLLPPSHVKVRFYVPEGRLAAVRAGQAVSVACNGCGNPVPATITYVSPRAEYTPPVIYSRENRTRLIFLVEARPRPEDATRLHPGQPVDVTLP